jgi:VanZ family protein
LWRWVFLDIILNVLLYVPLGALAYLTLARRRSRSAALTAATLLGFAMSVAMELLQAYDLGRDTGPLDVVTNTAGALAGAVLGLVFQPVLDRLAKRRARRSAVAAAGLGALWLGYQLYPFFPIFRLYRLYTARALLFHWPALRPVEIWTGAAEWLTIFLVLELLSQPFHALWLVAATMVLPLRIFIPDRSVDWNDLIAVVLGFLLVLGIPAALRVRFGVGIVCSAIAIGELAPFHFAARATAFSWTPFYATLAAERQSATQLILHKAFDYGAAVWLIHLAGWPYLRAAAIVASGLLVLEAVQRHIPGRTPESTDAVLALLMAVALWLASEFHAQRR